MSGMSLGALAEAIEGVVVHPDEREIALAVGLRDRLDAKISAAVGTFDAAGLWDSDGSVSMVAWLRAHTGRTSRQAKRTVATATKLRSLPQVQEAWVDGRLTGGHVDAIVAIVTDRTLPLFADQQALIVSGLAEATVEETVRFLQDWQARADALLDSQDDDPEPAAEPTRSLHLSPTLDGRGRLDASLDPEAHAIVRKALSLAQAPYTVGDDAKQAEELRADALVDIARFFLDHQTTRPGGRHRPHLNVIVTLQDLIDGGPARTAEDLPLDAVTLRRMACDAGIHRIITDGRSAILDYGRTTRTIPPAIYTSLVVRDRGCRFPGCDRPADWTEGHHITPWEHGGTTDLSNLVLLCSKHHHRIHLRGWHLKLLPTGTVEVTMPDGRVRTSRPPTGRP
jgi:5-methylcytosine-specific restriction endonuclease McrA